MKVRGLSYIDKNIHQTLKNQHFVYNDLYIHNYIHIYIYLIIIHVPVYNDLQRLRMKVKCFQKADQIMNCDTRQKGPSVFCLILTFDMHQASLAVAASIIIIIITLF